MAKKQKKEPVTPVPDPKAVVTEPICPHCLSTISSISWRDFADGRFRVVMCGHCKKVLGVTN